MSDKTYTVTMQWPVRYDFPPVAVGHFPHYKMTCKMPRNKAWKKIERPLHKATEK